MFQVGRYDPSRREKEPASSKSKKRGKKRKSEAGNEHSSLRVIAQEQKPTGGRPKLPPKAIDEAFDDLDLVEASIEGDVVEQDETDVRAGQVSEEEVQAALRMSSIPIEEAAEAWKLAGFLRDNLKRDGFDTFFPIQALSIPDVLASQRHAHIQAQDVCITAPTGSGKTLSYVLPILNALAKRQVRRLRALVVLPSRDLARQVYQVFESYVEGSDLRVGLAIGQSDFQAEQAALVDRGGGLQRLSTEPGNLELALQAFRQPVKKTSSAIDILVCTPGRLVDHLDSTPGFSLEDLCFLVADEADRLLNQSYHNWIDRVMESANSASTSAYRAMAANNGQLPALQNTNGCSYEMNPITWRRGGASGDYGTDFNTNDSYFSVAASTCRPVQLRKFLVSATLTRDPQKLASLYLVNPRHFDVHQLKRGNGDTTKKYSMPDGLAEYTIECTAEQKPLVLLALLLERLQDKTEKQKGIIIVFTASLDSTHRLVRVLQLLWCAAGYGETSTVSEFSSALSQRERTILMQRCSDINDNLSVVVCSDGMSRGMDIRFASSVVNYDVPSYAKTYVHRCGRCARAGQKGTAISLLKGGQVGQFGKMRQLIQEPEKVESIGVKKALLRDALPHYRQCMQALREVLEAEENGELSLTDVDLSDFLK